MKRHRNLTLIAVAGAISLVAACSSGTSTGGGASTATSSSSQAAGASTSASAAAPSSETSGSQSSAAPSGTGSGSSGSATGPSSPAASSPSGPMPTVTMMVGGIDKQIYLPYQLAQNLGFYQKYGVKVELSTEQNGGVGAEDAMASGQVDLAGAWYIHTVDFQSKGKKVINLVQLSGAPGEREMCATNSGVHSAADFKGKTLGVTDLGSGTDELTQFLASQKGIGKSDYHTLAVGAGATAIAAIQRGTAQCVMTTQPTVGALTSKNLAYPAIDLATVQGATQALGGAWPAAGLLARADWVSSHHDAAQRVVDALVATMHWIATHSAADIANNLPPDFVQNSTISKDQYVAGLTTDKGQFLPDGIMPAGGPKVIFAMEKGIGVDTSKITYSDTFTNDFAIAANQLEGFTITTKAAGADG
jgi:NitT/TauT family transport system substrate-binding protein